MAFRQPEKAWGAMGVGVWAFAAGVWILAVGLLLGVVVETSEGRPRRCSPVVVEPGSTLHNISSANLGRDGEFYSGCFTTTQAPASIVPPRAAVQHVFPNHRTAPGGLTNPDGPGGAFSTAAGVP